MRAVCHAGGRVALSAAVPGGDPYDDPGATQWFVLSDLGVSSLSGVDGMHVFVRSLKTAQAEAGVKVSLLSSANRVLDTVQTDADGHALFEAGLTRGTGGGAPALLVVEKGDQDIAFLSLKDPAFDLSDRGVEGCTGQDRTSDGHPDPRAAHQAGQGDQQHLHRTGPSRDRRLDVRRLPRTGWPPRDRHPNPPDDLCTRGLHSLTWARPR